VSHDDTLGSVAEIVGEGEHALVAENVEGTTASLRWRLASGE
jgi:hypothetical protein